MEKPGYDAHLFICVNDRGPGAKREFCSAKGSQALKDKVKKLCQGKAKVRINNSGCLGYCEHGIAAVMYPQGEWFLGLTQEDAPKLIDAIDNAKK